MKFSLCITSLTVSRDLPSSPILFFHSGLALMKYGSRSFHPQPLLPRDTQPLKSAIVPLNVTRSAVGFHHRATRMNLEYLSQFIALIVLPPPVTLAVRIAGVRLFSAVSGSVARPGQIYGNGFQSPGTRTPFCSLSNGPASMTRTLTGTYQHPSLAVCKWRSHILVGSSVNRSASVSPETPPPTMTKSYQLDSTARWET